jgi:sec-independent protein translocase protein TatA
MGRLGMGELVVILIIILIIFGAGKLPQIGEALGRGIRNFKKSSSGEDDKSKAEPPPPKQDGDKKA